MDTLIDFDKEEHLFTSDEKLKWWGYGEWVEEADRIEFTYKSYKCRISRVCLPEDFDENFYSGGYLCGYVEIPKDHRLFGNKEGIFLDIYGHLGITFNEVGKKHVIGFDCAHYCDFIPSSTLKKMQSNQLDDNVELLIKIFLKFPTYKNVNFVTEECMKIVDQLIEKQENAQKI